MEAQPPQFLSVSDAYGDRKLATLQTDGAAPGLFWMQGFMSDMVSTKAAALSEWSSAHGIQMTRFDYSGHGQSGGDFRKATVSQWLADSCAVFDALTSGPQIVIGSSMGGYLAMLLADAIAARGNSRVVGLILIAPAWDMTEELMWAEFPEPVRAEVMSNGVWMRPSAYGDPYPITRDLIEDGRSHLYGGEPWSPGCPTRIIHGRLDPDVPFAHGVALREMIAAAAPDADVDLIEVPDGEHRLSRPQDLDLLIKTTRDLRARLA
ncbi:MAG: alpha/beta hydrolase [Pseudomonadota bacterium]